MRSQRWNTLRFPGLQGLRCNTLCSKKATTRWALTFEFHFIFIWPFKNGKACLADKHKNRSGPNSAPALQEPGLELQLRDSFGIRLHHFLGPPAYPTLACTHGTAHPPRLLRGLWNVNTEWCYKSGAYTFQNRKARWCPGKTTGFTVTVTRLPPSTSWWHSADLRTWSFTALASVSPLAKHKEPFHWFGFVLQAQKALKTVSRMWSRGAWILSKVPATGPMAFILISTPGGVTFLPVPRSSGSGVNLGIGA